MEYAGQGECFNDPNYMGPMCPIACEEYLEEAKQIKSPGVKTQPKEGTNERKLEDPDLPVQEEANVPDVSKDDRAVDAPPLNKDNWG